jgi:hypothetical protein
MNQLMIPNGLIHESDEFISYDPEIFPNHSELAGGAYEQSLNCEVSCLEVYF